MDQTAASAASTPPRKKERDVRLDFFRGLSLLIIFMAHIYGNVMWWWIPARFGISDAADVFVFCSGFASGLAFYKLFGTHGFAMGTMRVGYRVWQVYWAHVLMTVGIVGLCSALTLWLPGENYLARWDLEAFAQNFDVNLGRLLTLQAQPGRSDILPMYITMLAAMPLAVALTWIHRYLGVAACVALYLYVQIVGATVPHAHGVWFFNPLAWQILFYAGFFLSSGVLPTPKARPALTVAALIYVLAAIPISYPWLLWNVEEVRTLREAIIPAGDKTNMHFLRALHFFSLAYLFGVAWSGLDRLLRRPLFAPIVLMGQHALAIFILGVALSILGDLALNLWGRHALSWFAVNAGGAAIFYLTARFLRAVRRADQGRARKGSRPVPQPAAAPILREKAA